MKKFLALILVIVAGLIIYGPSFHAPFEFDDYQRIVDNPVIRNFPDLSSIWLYEPSRFLAYYSFAVNYQFGQLNPFGYHLVNFFIHLLTTVLYFLFLKLLFVKTRGGGDNETQTIILFSSLIFLCHPLQTSAVTYIVQRSTLLAGFFYILIILFYVLARLKEKAVYDLIAVILFAVALLTKPIMVSLPLAIWLIDVCFFSKTSPQGHKRWQRILPFLSLIFIFCLFLTWHKYQSLSLGTFWNMSRETSSITRWQYVLTQLNVLMTYGRLFFIPIHLHLDYDYPVVENIFDLHMLVSLSLIACIFYLGYRLFQKERMITFAIFWIFVTLSPESSFFPIADVIFEHRMYLPMAGFALLLAVSLRRIIKEVKIYRLIMWLIVMVFSALSYQRNDVWADKIRFLEDMALHAPNKPRVLYHLAFGYDEAGRKDLALDIFNRILEKYPENVDAYFNRGLFYFLNKKYDPALTDFNRVIDFDPRYVKAYSKRGDIFKAKGQHDLALADYKTALDLMPNYVEVYNNRGGIYLQLKQYDLAMSDYQKALAFSPRYPQALNNRGVVYLLRNQFERALADFNLAVEIKPDFADAYFNRGSLLIKTGQYDLAIKDYSRGIAIDPSNKEAFFNRGGLYTVTGRLEMAIADYNKVFELDPSDDRAYNARGTIYQSRKEYDMALEDFNRAIALNPRNHFAYYNRSQIYHLQNNLSKALEDLLKARALGYPVDQQSIEQLKHPAATP